jgi:carbon monoxide dehydrogenase subunit G
MATKQNVGPSVSPALLFMPDISGFTRFVNETEILHGQHIVQELLEILIDSNEIGLTVNEIEGDAIFFYRMGEKPSLDSLLKQVEKMYFNFHRHLKLYDHQRICDCGACQAAIKLQLKVIAHYGEVTGMAVKDHQKLFGKDIIVLHRLLKNNIGEDEYILMTEALTDNVSASTDKAWFNKTQSSQTYDAGEVKFVYSLFSELRNQVPPPELPHYKMAEKASIGFVDQEEVSADMRKVFGAIVDLEQRPRWMDGVKRIEMVDHDKINRVGTQHRCIVNPKRNPVIVTESATAKEDLMELIEMDKSGMGGCRYQLTPAQEGTKIRVEVLVSKNPFVRMMFNLMMKNKYKKSIRQSLVNLKNYCVEEA